MSLLAVCKAWGNQQQKSIYMRPHKHISTFTHSSALVIWPSDAARADRRDVTGSRLPSVFTVPSIWEWLPDVGALPMHLQPTDQPLINHTGQYWHRVGGSSGPEGVGRFHQGKDKTSREAGCVSYNQKINPKNPQPPHNKTRRKTNHPKPRRLGKCRWSTLKPLHDICHI